MPAPCGPSPDSWSCRVRPAAARAPRRPGRGPRLPGRGRAVRLLGQPPVIGEILAGILLGPSLLGWLAPTVQHHLLPSSVLPVTSALGNLGLMAFLFLIGLELDLRSLRTTRGAVAAVSLAGLLLPLALGTALAAALYPHFAPDGVGRLPFTLFVAVALSITAFPVLARILADRGLETTPLGAFALACAATDDALAWCLLTAAVALATTGTALSALTTLALTAAYAAVLVLIRPLLRTLLERAGRTGDELVLALLFAGLCLSAYTTDQIGAHPAFGAFLFGAAAPRPAGRRAQRRAHPRRRPAAPAAAVLRRRRPAHRLLPPAHRTVGLGRGHPHRRRRR